jgi:hypothetical protein
MEVHGARFEEMPAPSPPPRHDLCRFLIIQTGLGLASNCAFLQQDLMQAFNSGFAAQMPCEFSTRICWAPKKSGLCLSINHAKSKSKPAEKSQEYVRTCICFLVFSFGICCSIHHSDLHQWSCCV